MVFVILTEEEIGEMVESFFRGEDGKSRIFTNGAVEEIVNSYCELEEDGKIETNLRDYLRYCIAFYPTVDEAVEDGIDIDEFSIVEDTNRYSGKSQVILIER